jgi:DNA modification methylase
MKFDNDAARREYFKEKLREKLKDPEFRKIEGFPIGEDEDILALSDPPYYTACPNPFLGAFIKHYGKPFNAKENYHREPFAADVNEGKTHPIYMAHSYHTKVPHKAIMRYILHYTKPGDIILDGFCGTGMTGVAAQLCGDPESIKALGYRVLDDGSVVDENNNEISKIGARLPILNDLSPIATFIANNYNKPVSMLSFDEFAKDFVEKTAQNYEWVYSTLHKPTNKHRDLLVQKLKSCKTFKDAKNLISGFGSDNKESNSIYSKIKLGRVNYIIFSDLFICSECGGEFAFWNVAVDMNAGKIANQFPCPHCKAVLTKKNIKNKKIVRFDPISQGTVQQSIRVPVLVNYVFKGKKYIKDADIFDLALSGFLQDIAPENWFPRLELPIGDKTKEAINAGYNYVHYFYTGRNLHVMAALWNETHGNSLLRLCLSSVLVKTASILHNIGLKKGNINLAGALPNAIYIPSTIAERNLFKLVKGKISDISKAKKVKLKGDYLVETKSFTQYSKEEFADYIFLDPPFGSNLMYSELNFIWESWIKILTNVEKEAIENRTQKKGLKDYQKLMRECFVEAYKALKPGRWMTIEFSNTRALVWNSIQTSLQEAGFVVANVAALDKGQGTFNSQTNPTSVKQDLVISAYKPNGGLERRFEKKAHIEEGIWDFIRTHLKNLPVVKPKGGQLEFITERDPRILYDRTVAFYVRHEIPVPLSSPEFQAGLVEKFPERDGMYFLSEQAAEYDKKRIQTEGLGQMTIWVQDERSAADWLRNYLKDKPSKYQDVQPEFFEQLNQSWRKWETRPELRALLDQYFLCYNGQGDVPPQIHSYMSSNFPDLRNLPSDHQSLRSKAKDRWYVPDPKKNADVEKLREKRLLEEFWTYLPPGYDVEAAKRGTAGYQPKLPGMDQPQAKTPRGKRLKLVRTEAVRVGFKHCYQNNDYQTIIATAHYIPEDVVNGDDQLQMIYDSAVTRSGSDI